MHCRFGVQGSYQNSLAAMYNMRRDAASVNYPDEVWLDAFELRKRAYTTIHMIAASANWPDQS